MRHRVESVSLRTAASALSLCSLIALALFFSSCGKGNCDSPLIVPHTSEISSAAQPESFSVDDLLSLVQETPAPEDVDERVFEMLKKEFLKELKKNPGRFTASVPTGDSGLVSDLDYDLETGTLSWSYVNLGDYDQSGDVVIADVGEVARHYLHERDGEGSFPDGYDVVIDGTGDSSISIADVAPIASNYLNSVSSYRILASDDVDAGFEELGTVPLSGAVVGFPKVFVVDLPVGSARYAAVLPLDVEGSEGEMSNVVDTEEGIVGPPNAEISANPTEGIAPLEVLFDASGSDDPGGGIVKFEWDFESDGIYDLDTGSVDNAGHTYYYAGTYRATLRVTDNDGGTGTDFALISVSEAGALRGDWWMFGREQSHKSRSKFDGPSSESLKWRYRAGDWIDSSPAIGADGTIYVGSDDGYLHAIKANGTIAWQYPVGGAFSSPALGADGTIYIGGYDRHLYAVNPDGTLKWQFETGDVIKSSPAIGWDGTIYVGSYDNRLYAVSSDGELKWSYETGDWVQSSPAIGADGTVYVGSRDNFLYAIAENGTLKWRYETEWSIVSSPAVAEDGTVYVGSWDEYLYAIDPAGGLKWRFKAEDFVISGPAIGEDGTIYVGSNDKYLYAITPEGSLKWRYATNAVVFSSPAISADGTVYVGSVDNYLYALNPDGSLKWRSLTGAGVWGSPAIGEDGTVYVGSDDNYLYAIGTNTGSEPVVVAGVTPTSANEGTRVLFHANVEGTPPFSYTWDFGLGGVPDDPSLASPEVVLGAPGVYDASVTVGNSFGPPDTFEFTLTVSDVGHGDWWMFGREITHNRRSPFSGPEFPNQKWNYETGGWILSSPATGSEGTVYVGSSDNFLYAINPSGSLEWQFETGGEVQSSPAVGDNGAIYFGSFDGFVYALDPDGNEKWSYETGGAVHSSPAIGADGTIYIGSNNGYLYALSPDGGFEWSFQAGEGVWVLSSPAIGGDGTIYFGSQDNNVYALNPDGGLKWNYETGGMIWSSPAISSDGTVYIGSGDGYLYAVGSDGVLNWRHVTGGAANSSPAIGADGTIYVGSDDRYLYAIHPAGGLKWRFETADTVFSSPAVDSDGTVYVGSWDGHLYAVSSEGVEKWRYETGWNVYSSPAIGADGTVYFGSGDSFLYAIGK